MPVSWLGPPSEKRSGAAPSISGLGLCPAGRGDDRHGVFHPLWIYAMPRGEGG